MIAATLAYRIAVGALMLCILASGAGPMKRTILTILGVYLFQLWLADRLWPAPEWSLVMIFADALAAFVIAYHPAGRVQALIACTFILQMLLHFGRYFNGADSDMILYYWGLWGLGMLQLALTGGWWLSGLLSRRDSNSGADPHPGPSYRQGVAQ